MNVFSESSTDSTTNLNIILCYVYYISRHANFVIYENNINVMQNKVNTMTKDNFVDK